MLPLYLSEAGSSVLHLLPILGAALILPGLVNPTSAVQRTGLFVVAILLSLRYLWWRATETIAPLGLTVDWAASWSLFALEALAMIGSFSAFIIMMRYRDRGEEATRNAGWWGSRAELQASKLRSGRQSSAR